MDRWLSESPKFAEDRETGRLYRVVPRASAQKMCEKVKAYVNHGWKPPSKRTICVSLLSAEDDLCRGVRGDKTSTRNSDLDQLAWKYSDLPGFSARKPLTLDEYSSLLLSPRDNYILWLNDKMHGMGLNALQISRRFRSHPLSHENVRQIISRAKKARSLGIFGLKAAKNAKPIPRYTNVRRNRKKGIVYTKVYVPIVPAWAVVRPLYPNMTFDEYLNLRGPVFEIDSLYHCDQCILNDSRFFREREKKKIPAKSIGAKVSGRSCHTPEKSKGVQEAIFVPSDSSEHSKTLSKEDRYARS